jgi:hypothetical protein
VPPTTTAADPLICIHDLQILRVILLFKRISFSPDLEALTLEASANA